MSLIFNIILGLAAIYFVGLALGYLALFGTIWAVILFDKACDLIAWPFEKLFGQKKDF